MSHQSPFSRPSVIKNEPFRNSLPRERATRASKREIVGGQPAYWRRPGFTDARYLAKLTEWGYEPSEIEQTVIDRSNQSDEDDDEFDVPTCRVCGCTDDEACEGGCSWVEDPEGIGELCSTCADA